MSEPLKRIILVGLLGKVFGPAGMLWSVARGNLPANMAWICLTNDLIWWVPFALILGGAYKLHQQRLLCGNPSQTK